MTWPFAKFGCQLRSFWRYAGDVGDGRKCPISTITAREPYGAYFADASRRARPLVSLNHGPAESAGAIVTIVGTRNGRQGITFHTSTKNTSSGQPEEGYSWHMKKTFSDKVRDIVRKIPKRKTMTYKEVASKAGNPKAARAVGAVMRSNYDPSIPCHRVVASDGKVRGYNRGARIR